MKIAITGKGEVGKTTLSGTLTFLSSRTYKVFAIDAEPGYEPGKQHGHPLQNHPPYPR